MRDDRCYRRDIDGLRAVAIIAVLLNHMGLLAGGLVGVDVFFVISGFLISGIILRALAHGTFSIPHFYARRVKRIFPALLVVLVATWVAGSLLLLPDEFQRLGGDLTQGATFTLNFFQHNPFYSGPAILLLDHLWSLGVEEQFYLFWPLLLMLTALLGRGQLLVILVTATASLVLNIVMSYHDPRWSYQLPWTRLWELAFGGALAYVQLHGAAGWNGFAPAADGRGLRALLGHHAWSVAGAALILATSLSHIDSTVDPGWWALPPCAGALLLLSSGPQALVNRRILSTPVMVYIGLISYSLYLWHFPLLVAARLPGYGLRLRWVLVVIAITFLLASATYKYVEAPARTSRSMKLLPGVLCTLMACCAAIGFLAFEQRITARPLPLNVSGFIQTAMVDWLPGTQRTFWTQFPRNYLELGSGPRTVLYLGDSDMQQYYPRISRILADRPPQTHRAVFAVYDQCAPGGIDVADTDDSGRATCAAFLEHALEYARDPSIDAVVIAACWSCYFVPLGDVLFVREGRLKRNSDAALRHLEQFVSELRSWHKRVYLVLDVPLGLDFDPHQMVGRSVLVSRFHLTVSTPQRAEVSHVLAPINGRLLQIARTTGAVAIDPLQALCGPTTCPAVSSSGAPVYHDWWRLNPSYVRDNVRFLDETVLDTPLHATAY